MNILIADDHAVVRRGLRDILSEAIPGTSFVEAGSGDEVISQLAKAKIGLSYSISICPDGAAWTF